MKEYYDILSAMEEGEKLFYLSVPKCKIEYIEMPSIETIFKADNGYRTNAMEVEDLDDTVYSFQADTDFIYLFHADKDKLIKEFVTYYNQYLENLKIEYEFLMESIPRIAHTEMVKTSVDTKPEIWV